MTLKVTSKSPALNKFGNTPPTHEQRGHTWKRSLLPVSVFALIVSCSGTASSPKPSTAPSSSSHAAAASTPNPAGSVVAGATPLHDRSSFETRFQLEWPSEREAPERIHPDSLVPVTYPTSLGDMRAYLSPQPTDKELHPAVLWVRDGPGPGYRDFDLRADQAFVDLADTFVQSGIVLMAPSFRGQDGNPGNPELDYGELSDLLAAADHLRSLPYVDPERVYLMGAGEGAGLAFLAAESSDFQKASVLLGPHYTTRFADRVSQFKAGELDNIEKEERLRSPANYLESLRRPTLVLESAIGTAYEDEWSDAFDRATDANIPLQTSDSAEMLRYDELVSIATPHLAKFVQSGGHNFQQLLNNFESSYDEYHSKLTFVPYQLPNGLGTIKMPKGAIVSPFREYADGKMIANAEHRGASGIVLVCIADFLIKTQQQARSYFFWTDTGPEWCPSRSMIPKHTTEAQLKEIEESRIVTDERWKRAIILEQTDIEPATADSSGYTLARRTYYFPGVSIELLYTGGENTAAMRDFIEGLTPSKKARRMKPRAP